VSGRFTPNVDGPNVVRKGSRNNIGDVWVVATYAAAADAGKPAARVRARAWLPSRRGRERVEARRWYR